MTITPLALLMLVLTDLNDGRDLSKWLASRKRRGRTMHAPVVLSLKPKCHMSHISRHEHEFLAGDEYQTRGGKSCQNDSKKSDLWYNIEYN